jgi:hypothetical protein
VLNNPSVHATASTKSQFSTVRTARTSKQANVLTDCWWLVIIIIGESVSWILNAHPALCDLVADLTTEESPLNRLAWHNAALTLSLSLFDSTPQESLRVAAGPSHGGRGKAVSTEKGTRESFCIIIIVALLDSTAPQKIMASRHHYHPNQRQQPQEGFNTEGFTERVLVRNFLSSSTLGVALLFQGAIGKDGKEGKWKRGAF